MKTKTEVRAKLLKLYAWKKKAKSAVIAKDKELSSLTKPFEIVDAQARVLKWILGYKQNGEYYWCFRCELSHKNLSCPKCGSNTSIFEPSSPRGKGVRQEMSELRERIKIELIAKCPFVDKCERQCTPTDQEDCYGQHADAIMPRIKEFGYLSPEEGALQNNEYAHFVISHIWQFASGVDSPLKWTIFDNDFKSVLKHYGIKWGVERLAPEVKE